MTASLEEIRIKVLKRVNPSLNERQTVRKLALKLKKKLKKAAKDKGVKINVRTEGSVAKNTWLRDCSEIDIFMQVPITTPRESFGTLYLEIAKKATEGHEQIERYAEHPYLEAIIDDIVINIVPCYDTKTGEWISATDRTPFHTNYIKKHLNEKLAEEIRLLKRFMKGVNVYGAEIKVGGFSGYLCELLVLKYGSFAEVLRSACNWKERIIIDYEGQYKNKQLIKQNFVEPLVMIDPVDKNRNVAAAVRKERLNEFIAASRAFMKNPNVIFFYPPETKPLSVKQIVNRISFRDSTIVFIKFNGTAVSDILWGQLYKSQRALRNLITKSDFKIFRDIVWTDEKNLNVFLFEIENRYLPNLKHHLGPPIKNREACEKFLRKYNRKDLVISGPRIKNGTWLVDLSRDYKDVVELLNEKLEDGGRKSGLGKIVSKAIEGSLEILVNNQVLKLYKSHSGFAKFLSEYLEGKPKWLQ